MTTPDLDRAAALGYSDSRNMAKKATLAPEFVRNAVAVAKSESLEPVWLAGFYFSSALMRISALNERIDTMAKARAGSAKRDIAKKVRKTVNMLKHETDAHVVGNWKLVFVEVVDTLENLTVKLESLLGTKTDA